MPKHLQSPNLRLVAPTGVYWGMLMKKLHLAVFPVVLPIVLLSCQTSPGQTRRATEDLGISARGAIGRLEAAFDGPMYLGDGGRSINLAVLAPETQGDLPDFLPLYIQGMLNNNLNRFSAINLIDRQNLNRIITEQDLAAGGRFSERDFVSIGNLANAQYLLFGTIQRLSGNRFSLQLSITEAGTGLRRATFMQDGTLAQLEGRGTLLNEATAELLGQMGVQLTELGMQTLLAGNIFAVQAEAGLARGIIAQAGGAEVQALLNFAQATTFDPVQLEALARLNTLSTAISGGTISKRILQDFQLRDQWLEAFRETARFFDNHPPFQIVFDPSLQQIGEADFGRRTVNLGMRIALDPSVAGFDVLNALLEGLEETGRRDAWGFSGWPLEDISPRDRGTVVFRGRRSFSYRIDVALINENNRTIGNGRVILETEAIIFAAGDTSIMPPLSVEGFVNFPNVMVDRLTPNLTIAIVAVNGIRARNLSASGYMRIKPGELEISGHAGGVNSVAFGPHGRQFISGSLDNSIKLWDTATGRVIRTFSGHTDRVISVAFSPDARHIVSSSFDNTVKLWDATTGRVIGTFPDHAGMVSSVAFSPDGRQFISGSSDNTLKLRDTATGQVIRTFSGHTDTVSAVAFSPDGRYLVSGSRVFMDNNPPENAMKLWDVATGQEIRAFIAEGGFFDSLAFSPDGNYIISGAGWGGAGIRLWSVATGREIRSFDFGFGVRSVSFSPNGRYIAAGANPMYGSSPIRLWDVTTGEEARTFSGHAEPIWSVSFSPDGRHIISGSLDTTIKLWDVATGRLIRTIGTAVYHDF